MKSLRAAVSTAIICMSLLTCALAQQAPVTSATAGGAKGGGIPEGAIDGSKGYVSGDPCATIAANLTAAVATNPQSVDLYLGNFSTLFANGIVPCQSNPFENQVFSGRIYLGPIQIVKSVPWLTPGNNQRVGIFGDGTSDPGIAIASTNSTITDCDADAPGWNGSACVIGAVTVPAFPSTGHCIAFTYPHGSFGAATYCPTLWLGGMGAAAVTFGGSFGSVIQDFTIQPGKGGGNFGVYSSGIQEQSYCLNVVVRDSNNAGFFFDKVQGNGSGPGHFKMTGCTARAGLDATQAPAQGYPTVSNQIGMGYGIWNEGNGIVVYFTGGTCTTYPQGYPTTIAGGAVTAIKMTYAGSCSNVTGLTCHIGTQHGGTGETCAATTSVNTVTGITAGGVGTGYSLGDTQTGGAFEIEDATINGKNTQSMQEAIVLDGLFSPSVRSIHTGYDAGYGIHLGYGSGALTGGVFENNDLENTSNGVYRIGVGVDFNQTLIYTGKGGSVNAIQNDNATGPTGLPCSDSQGSTQPTSLYIPCGVPVENSGLLDQNQNPWIQQTAAANAVDGVNVANAATANPATVTISASGTDANINLNLAAKGTGTVTGVNLTPVVRSGLIGQFAFTDNSGTTLTDSSGNGNNGTLCAAGAAPTWVGAPTGGLNFVAASSQCVTLPSALNAAATIQIFSNNQVQTIAGSATFLCPLAGNGTAANTAALCQVDSNTGASSGFGATGTYSNSLFLTYKAGATITFLPEASNLGTSLTTWVQDATSDLLYYGSLAQTPFSAPAGSAGVQTAGVYQFGGRGAGYINGNSSFWSGKMYYAVFYNRKLTSAEIAQNSAAITQIMASRNLAFLAGSTATKNMYVIDGDSLPGANGAWLKYAFPIASDGAWQAVYTGFSGSGIVALQTQSGLYRDDVYCPNSPGTGNCILDVQVGTNDLSGLNLANWLPQYTQFIAQRKAFGHYSQIWINTVVDNASHANKNLMNAAILQSWQSMGATGVIPVGEDPNLGCDACNVGVYFAGDNLHPSALGQYEIAHIQQPNINRSTNGNFSFSVANTYTTTAVAATTITAASEATNTVTITAASIPAGVVPGVDVTITGMTPAGYNTSATNVCHVLTVTATTFTCLNSTAALGAGSAFGAFTTPTQQDIDAYVILAGSATSPNFTLEPCGSWVGNSNIQGWDGRIRIKNANTTSPWTITPFAAETIDGASSLVMPVASSGNNPVVVLEAVALAPSTGGCNWRSISGTPVVLSGNNAQTSTYQVLANDFSAHNNITVASGTFTITLVANTSQPAAGQFINIINYGSGSVTIARSGQNINGAAANIVLPPANNAQQPSAAYVESDAANYFASVSGSNAATLGNKTFAAPNPIGSGTPNTGSFTSLLATGVIVGGNTVRLTADSAGITATTPGTTFLTLGTLAANTNYSFFCEVLYSQATAAVLDGFSVQAATNAATRWDAWGSMDTTNPASTTMTGSKGSALNVTTTTSTPVVSATPGATATVFQARLTGSIQVGASVPSVQIAAFTGNASDAVTVKAGSFCTTTP